MVGNRLFICSINEPKSNNKVTNRTEFAYGSKKRFEKKLLVKEIYKIIADKQYSDGLSIMRHLAQMQCVHVMEKNGAFYIEVT